MTARHVPLVFLFCSVATLHLLHRPPSVLGIRDEGDADQYLGSDVLASGTLKEVSKPTMPKHGWSTFVEDIEEGDIGIKVSKYLTMVVAQRKNAWYDLALIRREGDFTVTQAEKEFQREDSVLLEAGGNTDIVVPLPPNGIQTLKDALGAKVRAAWNVENAPEGVVDEILKHAQRAVVGGGATEILLGDDPANPMVLISTGIMLVPIPGPLSVIKQIPTTIAFDELSGDITISVFSNFKLMSAEFDEPEGRVANALAMKQVIQMKFKMTLNKKLRGEKMGIGDATLQCKIDVVDNPALPAYIQKMDDEITRKEEELATVEATSKKPGVLDALTLALEMMTTDLDALKVERQLYG